MIYINSSNHISDNDTFKDILMFINEHNLHQVKAIIWNINPNIREDDLITRQAYLINLFKEDEIWKNVIIICKKVYFGFTSSNLKIDVFKFMIYSKQLKCILFNFKQRSRRILKKTQLVLLLLPRNI